MFNLELKFEAPDPSKMMNFDRNFLKILEFYFFVLKTCRKMIKVIGNTQKHTNSLIHPILSLPSPYILYREYKKKIICLFRPPECTKSTQNVLETPNVDQWKHFYFCTKTDFLIFRHQKFQKFGKNSEIPLFPSYRK